MEDCQGNPILDKIDEISKRLILTHKFLDCYILEDQNLHDLYNRSLKKINQSRLKDERKSQNKRKIEFSSDYKENVKKKKYQRSNSHSVDKETNVITSNTSSPVQSNPVKKNKSLLKICCICNQPINAKYSGLPIGAIYCSKFCITKQIQIANQCVKNNEPIMLMNMNGMLFNESKKPTIDTLEMFLIQYPNFRPVLNMNNLEKSTKKEFDEQHDKKMEGKRVDVKKAIEQILLLRSKSAQITFSTKRLKTISADIEEELHRLHKSINFKYRSWCKGFILKLKDELNDFFLKIVHEKVSSKKLVTMNPDEMIVSSFNTNSKDIINNIVTTNINQNKDFEKTPEKQVLANVEIESFPVEDSTTTGEVSADSENAKSNADVINANNNIIVEEKPISDKVDADLNNLIRITNRSTKHTMVKKKPLFKVEAKSAIDDILGDGERDTTGQHNSHLYDANCAICQNKTKLDFAAKERAERLEAKFEAKMRINKEENKIKIPRFPNLKEDHNLDTHNTSIISPTKILINNDSCADDCEASYFDDEDEFVSVSRSNDSNKSKIENNNKSLNNETPDKTPQEKNKNSLSQDDSVANNLIPMWEREPISFSRELPSLMEKTVYENSWKRPSTFSNNNDGFSSGNEVIIREENPWLIRKHKVWKGSVQWGRKFQFTCSLTAVSNRVAFKIGRELPLVTKVIGRIEPFNVWEYIRSLRDSWSKQVIVLIVDPPIGKTSEETKNQHSRCYELMKKEKKYGVIDFSNHATIKDGYVFPLEPGEPLPKDLYPLEGPGLPEGVEQFRNIILVLVRKMNREEHLASQEYQNESWRSITNEAEKNDLKKWEPNTITATTHKMSDDDNFINEKRQKFLQTQELTDTNDSKSQKIESNEFSLIQRRRTSPLLRDPPSTSKRLSIDFIDDFKPSCSTYNNTGKKVLLPGVMPLNYERSRYNSNKTRFFNNNSFKHNRSKLSPVSHPRNGPVLDLSIDNSSFPIVDTLEEVLLAIKTMQKPAQIVLMVGHYINTHQISEEESEIISEAIQAKSEVERSRNFKSLSNDSLPNSSNIIKSPLNVVNDKLFNDQLNETNQNYTINNRQDDKTISSFDSKTKKSNDDKTEQINCPQPEHFDIVKLRRPVREVSESIHNQHANDKIATEIKNNLKSNVVDNESDSSDADSTKAQQISFMDNNKNKNISRSSPEIFTVTSTAPLSVSSSVPLMNLTSTHLLPVPAASVSMSVLSSTPLFVPPSTSMPISLSTLPLVSDSFIKPSISSSTVQCTLFSPPFPPPPPPIPNINVSLQPPLPPIPHSLIKKSILPVPIPIPPPVPMQYGYVFAPPPPPIPLPILPIHQPASMVTIQSPLSNANQIKTADKSFSDDMMDISDSDSEDDKTKKTSLLPPPPPPPRLPFFFK